jgi:hypothetical protein
LSPTLEDKEALQLPSPPT